MRKIFFLVLVIMAVSCNEEKQETFTVEGSIKNSRDSMIYLEENPIDSQPMIVDSARIENGQFKLTTVVNDESLFSLRTSSGVYPFALLINDNRKVTVDADLSNQTSPYTVKGSEASQAMLDFDQKIDQSLRMHFRSVKEIDSLRKMQSSVPASSRNQLDSIINMRFAQYEANSDALKDYARDFINNSKSPVLALYAFGSFQTRATQFGMKDFTQAETIDIVNEISARFPDNIALNEQKKKLKPAIAPDFNLPDTTGNSISLSSMRGKWVLVDFWASWCVPCRNENPNIVSAYNKFRDRNFTILGVSLDDNKNAWLQAIQQDGLNWPHVSDLKGWSSQAAMLYGVRSIPFNVLVDPSGNVVAENLHGQALHDALGRYIK